jgi:hypothetical protein
MASRAPFGCLILASGIERDPARAQLLDDHLDALIAAAALLEAAPIVVVHDGTARVSPPARALRMPRPARDDLSALRLGLLQFTNAPIGAALILPIESHTASHATLRRLIDEAQERKAPIAATATNGTLGFPLFATRDAWRLLLTTEGGLDAVLRVHAPGILAIEPEA